MSKERLIDHGLAWFSRDGFVASGLDPVLKQAGVPKGSFYHYFRSKHEFALEVLKAYEHFFARRIEQTLLVKHLSLEERLTAFIRAGEEGLTKHNFERGCLVATLSAELASLDQPLREALIAIRERWDESMLACLEQTGYQGSLSLSRFFWNAWEGSVQRAKLTTSLMPLHDFQEQILLRLQSNQLK